MYNFFLFFLFFFFNWIVFNHSLLLIFDKIKYNYSFFDFYTFFWTNHLYIYLYLIFFIFFNKFFLNKIIYICTYIYIFEIQFTILNSYNNLENLNIFTVLYNTLLENTFNKLHPIFFYLIFALYILSSKNLITKTTSIVKFEINFFFFILKTE